MTEHCSKQFDPTDIAFQNFFMEIPTTWKRYDFIHMSQSEQNAAAYWVKFGIAELRVRCTVKIPGLHQKIVATAVVCGDYWLTVCGGLSLQKELANLGRNLEGGDQSPRFFIGVVKMALRFTETGERVRMEYIAGDAHSLWENVHVVPGVVSFENIKIIDSPPNQAGTKETFQENGPPVAKQVSPAPIILSNAKKHV